jgi:hypothetical protein
MARAKPKKAGGPSEPYLITYDGTTYRLRVHVSRLEEYSLATLAAFRSSRKFAPGKKAPWHPVLRPHLLACPEACHNTDRLVALLGQLDRRRIVRLFHEEDGTCRTVRRLCSSGVHIHWDHRRRGIVYTVSLDQVRRFARSVVPRPQK